MHQVWVYLRSPARFSFARPSDTCSTWFIPSSFANARAVLLIWLDGHACIFFNVLTSNIHPLTHSQVITGWTHNSPSDTRHDPISRLFAVVQFFRTCRKSKQRGWPLRFWASTLASSWAKILFWDLVMWRAPRKQSRSAIRSPWHQTGEST